MSAAGRAAMIDFALCPAHACRNCKRCPHTVIGPPIWGASEVFINGYPALRLLDFGIHAACCGPNVWVALMCTQVREVMIEGQTAFCVSDITLHCGKSLGMLMTGSGDVYMGQGSASP